MRRTQVTAVLACAATIVSASFVSENTTASAITLGTSFGYGTACQVWYPLLSGIQDIEKNIQICGPGVDPKSNTVKPDWENFDDNLALKDVYYNGTATLTAHRTIRLIECDKTWSLKTNASLAIGDLTGLPSNPNSTRLGWDKNPFFFQFSSGNVTQPAADPYEVWSVDFKSSSSRFLWGQAWTLSSTKSGDGFNISGRYTTTKLNAGNNFNFKSAKCISGSAPVINTNWNITMTGYVSPQSASIKITMEVQTNETTILEFSGAAWSAGPKLLTTGSQIATEGTLKGSTSAAIVMVPSLLSASFTVFIALLFWL